MAIFFLIVLCLSVGLCSMLYGVVLSGFPYSVFYFCSVLSILYCESVKCEVGMDSFSIFIFFLSIFFVFVFVFVDVARSACKEFGDGGGVNGGGRFGGNESNSDVAGMSYLSMVSRLLVRMYESERV